MGSNYKVNHLFYYKEQCDGWDSGKGEEMVTALVFTGSNLSHYILVDRFDFFIQGFMFIILLLLHVAWHPTV